MRARTAGVLFAATIAAIGVARLAHAQDEARNYNKPVLVVETGGHSAEVWAIAWPGAETLLSAGMDKTVRVWDLTPTPRLAQTIRPPAWRGEMGKIYAMALSRAGADGQAFLAVGGYGVDSQRGDFTVFRYPGLTRAPTGEPVVRRLSGRPGAPGHTDSILCMTFSPDGRTLLTGGNDGRIIAWTVPGFEPTVLPDDPVALPPGWRRDVRTLAFTPDGTRFASGGGDGALRLWDLATRRVVQRRLGNNAGPAAINRLAFSPDGAHLFVGLEAGPLVRFDPRALVQAAVALPTEPARQGPVEAIVVSPDGQTLATSILSDRTDPVDPARLGCDVEIRRLPDGAVLHRRRVLGLVRALAYRPDGKEIAYAGGPSHAIERIAVGNPNPAVAPRPLRGEGSNIYELAFTADSQAIAYATEPSAPGRPPADLDGFDLARRRRRLVTRAGLTGPVAPLGGWSLEISVRQYRATVVHGDGRRRALPLEAATDRNPWSSSFVPPGPGHPRPLVALGCESGIVLFDFLADDPAPAADARRVRGLIGHAGPVTALAVSPDGRWLASGGFDQTIRLHALDGRDRAPRFGATLAARSDGLVRVASVETIGAAAEMGVRAGDIVLRASSAGATGPREASSTAEKLAFPAVADALPPGRAIGLQVLQPTWLAPGLAAFLPRAVQTTRRDNPALSLAPGRDQQWVVWTPQGYYDASVEGDLLRLGWQINPRFDRAEPTDFLPVVAHSATMYRPRVIDQLWQTGRLVLGENDAPTRAREPEDIAAIRRAPEIRFEPVPDGPALPAVGATWAVAGPDARLKLSIAGGDRSRVVERQIHLDGTLLPRPPLAGPLPRVDEELVLTGLMPGRTARLAVRALSEDRIARVDYLDVRLEPAAPPEPAPPARPPRVVVLGIGPSATPGAGLPERPLAAADVATLGGFLPRVLLAPSGERPALETPTDRRLLRGAAASHKGVLESLQWLRGELQARRVGRGDLVVVVVSAHVLAVDEAAGDATGDAPEIVALADTRLEPGKTPVAAVSAAELAERLGEASDYGCRVVVFLDGVHDLGESSSLRASVRRLTRDLWYGRGVVTFVASENGPSLRDDTRGQGLFTLGLQGAFRKAGTRPDPSAPYTLAEFADAARAEVSDLSGRLQDLGCHIPLRLRPDTPFAIVP